MIDGGSKNFKVQKGLLVFWAALFGAASVIAIAKYRPNKSAVSKCTAAARQCLVTACTFKCAFLFLIALSVFCCRSYHGPIASRQLNAFLMGLDISPDFATFGRRCLGVCACACVNHSYGRTGRVQRTRRQGRTNAPLCAPIYLISVRAVKNTRWRCFSTPLGRSGANRGFRAGLELRLIVGSNC